MRIFFSLLFIYQIALINSKIISTSNLREGLEVASFGDIIELRQGLYHDVPYELKSGITIQPEKGANVKFLGKTTNCIFDFKEVSDAKIYGPMDFEGGKCGINAIESNHLIIKGLTIHENRDEAIVISGNYNMIYDNEIFNCVIDNKGKAQYIEQGWTSCIKINGVNSDKEFSHNTIIYNNKIYNTWGEGINLHNCKECDIMKNNITNSYSSLIILEESIDSEISGNILRVTSDEYNSKYGRPNGIHLTSNTDNNKKVDNLIISNNIVMGTSSSVYFSQGAYDNIKIYHNTFWFNYGTPLLFKSPNNNPRNCQLINNFK